MSSLTNNINNNEYVVNVGRTTPVSPGRQTSDKSIPVVIASDQEAIPVVEQNKIISEVSLSLLGIPRAEVALGIFADVNTYDVNPSEWSAEPEEYTVTNGDGWGIKHLPEEAGALIEAPKDKVAVLTSKRFFRYQPGRVSAATFGVKSTLSPSSNLSTKKYDRNPSIRKYGIFDKFDGYYWETRANSTGDNFSVVRRSQSLLRNNPLLYPSEQISDHGLIGKAPNVSSEEPNVYPTATQFLIDNRFDIIETAFADAAAASTDVNNLPVDLKIKCKRDMDLAMEAYILDLQYGGSGHTLVNATTYRMALLNNTNTETTVHTQLGIAIRAALVGISETVAANRIYVAGPPITGLVATTLSAVAGTQPTSQVLNTDSNYGRSKIETIFSVYSRFYGYLASEYAYNPDTFTASQNTDYSSGASTLSADEIKYRCYRDVTYIVEGYGKDLRFGGNASTIYNAKRYYFADAQRYLQVYSQGLSGATGEINRHTFIKDLLTRTGTMTIGTKTNFQSLATLFSLNDVQISKLNELSQLIIANFSQEYKGAIEYGSDSNYGDLVVLRDGLVMTHAAVFDPSLLKKTKNVVVKPGFSVKTTNSEQATNGATTITLASATGVTVGMSVNASVAGVQDGTFVRSISGNVITLSTAVNATIPQNSTISFGDSTLESSQGEFVVGQHVNFYGTSTGASSHGLTANRLYRVEKVRGAKGNIITVSDVTAATKFTANITGTTLTVTSLAGVTLSIGTKIVGKGIPDNTYLASGSGSSWTLNNAVVGALTGVEVTKIAVIKADPDPAIPVLIHINPNVPFVFPTEYFVGKADDPDTGDVLPFVKTDGLFPLLYTRTGVLPADPVNEEDKVGFIDTTIVESNPVVFKQQMDTVNLIYNNWVKQNVDPKYYGVYEFRIPRSRFSTDQLNGLVGNKTVYSDVAIGNVDQGKVYPGDIVYKDENALLTNSVWDIDFTKVTMLKVEFSWYGAVGALFLAYVPVGNGEARWVRVHHLRASNQLKISSLGNATLPITYLVYGGGSVDRLGILDNTNKGYNSSKSDHIVKYGASYYIDGGDRGTVRLYSHSNLENINVFGNKFALPALNSSNFDTDSIGYYIDVSSVTSQDVPGWPSDIRYFMKAKVSSSSQVDQNVEVIWVSDVNNVKKLYLNKTLNSTSSILLTASRSSISFGLKAKENILNVVGTGIRNRVQVYPTKLSTSCSAPINVNTIPRVKLQLLKTPLFQPATSVTGNFTLSSPYDITPANAALTTSTPNFFGKDGLSLYGWFRSTVGTVFGMLYKKTGKYYFTLLETYSDPVTLLSGINFLPDGRFKFDGTSLNLSDVSEDSVQKERLSSVFVSTQIQTPIPKTGTEVSTFFLQQGSDMFDLLSYFDYNKDYLSFPLTDKVESIYLSASSVQPATATSNIPTPVAEISCSLTWEEQ